MRLRQVKQTQLINDDLINLIVIRCQPFSVCMMFPSKVRRFCTSRKPSGPPDEPFKFVDVHRVWEELAEPPYATVGIQRYAHYPVSYTHLTLPTNREV